MLRRNLPWLLPAVAAASTAPLWRDDDGDGRVFAAVGRTLFSTHALHAFADPSIQVGPLQLLFYGSVGRSPAAAAVVLEAVAAVLLVVTARAIGIADPRLLAGVGVAGVLTGVTRGVYEAGHPADGLLPLLWVIAAADARRGRVVRAGALVGLSAGIETWGMLGVAVLVLAPRAAALAIGTAAALFAPFLLGGHFESFHHVWTVSPHSVLLGRVAPGIGFGWPLRLVQAGAAVCVGAGAAVQLRRSPHVVWLVPIVVVAVRLLLDPLDTDYYPLGIAMCSLVGGALWSIQPWPRIVTGWWPVSTTSRASSSPSGRRRSIASSD